MLVQPTTASLCSASRASLAACDRVEPGQTGGTVGKFDPVSSNKCPSRPVQPAEAASSGSTGTWPAVEVARSRRLLPGAPGPRGRPLAALCRPLTPRPLRRTPEDLGPAGRTLWEDVCATFTLDPHELATLESACRELDRAHAADQALARAGEFVLDRYQQAKAHPAIAVARSSRLAAARLVQALGLPAKET
jgi:hypothetical protein